MHSSEIELGSFVSKFRNLWAAGRVAQLNVECHHGVATVGLRVQLGRAPAPVHRHHGQHQHQPGLRKTPAQQRRKARRAAERAAAVNAAKEEAEKVVTSVVEDSINDAVEIAVKAVAKKEAEEASTARVQTAVIAVGSDVAAAAKKIADKAMAKKIAEEAVTVKRAKEVAAMKRAEEAAAMKAAQEAEEALNATAHVECENDITSSRIRNDWEAREHPRDWPAPRWFCDAIGTYRNFHGNTKLLISDQLNKCIAHHATMIIHSKFTRQLWIHMSYLPLNKDCFDPVDTPFERIFGSELVKWTDVRAYLQDHVYFNSTLVGVFSGKKMPGY